MKGTTIHMRPFFVLTRFLVLVACALAPAALTAPRLEAQVVDQWHPVPKDTVAPNVYNGWKQFQLNCARCHGEDATGTTFAPNLLISLGPEGQITTQAIFLTTVCSGRPDKGMPAWCSLDLSMPIILDLYAYVKLRSDHKMGPGRPAVRQPPPAPNDSTKPDSANKQ
jgi:mono/diheme cytochrome c family protein